MILRGSTKTDAFLSAISSTIAKRPSPITYEQISNAAAHDDVVVYLAGGYWRAQLLFGVDGNFSGCRLINPDRTPDEIAAVERGIAIMCHFDYQPRSTMLDED